MKTIEEAAKEYYIKNYCKADENDNIRELSNIFMAGAEFVQRWIPVDEELPESYETGLWRCKVSDSVLVLCSNGYWTKAKSFSRIVNGEPINEWYVEGGDILPDVTHWRPIEVKQEEKK